MTRFYFLIPHGDKIYHTARVLSFFFFFQAEDGIRDLTVTGVQSCVFLQAEDGIRDLTVTGVQTCALPISLWCDPSNSPSRSTFAAATRGSGIGCAYPAGTTPKSTGPGSGTAPAGSPDMTPSTL